MSTGAGASGALTSLVFTPVIPALCEFYMSPSSLAASLGRRHGRPLTIDQPAELGGIYLK